jgi:hypothetical protein
MRRNPAKGWKISDVQTVCGGEGITCSAPKRGDHYKVSHSDLPEILTIPAHRPIKPVYIRKLVDFIDRVRGK